MSLSRYMENAVTNFRNSSLTNAPKSSVSFATLALSEMGYIAIVPFELIESVLSTIGLAFAKCIPVNQKLSETLREWSASSTDTLSRTCTYIVMNFYCKNYLLAGHGFKY